jgi:hypothetical protein
VTEHARAVGGAMFGQLGRHIAPVLADYDDEQLALVAEFLDKAAQATRAARETILSERSGQA